MADELSCYGCVLWDPWLLLFQLEKGVIDQFLSSVEQQLEKESGKSINWNYHLDREILQTSTFSGCFNKVPIYLVDRFTDFSVSYPLFHTFAKDSF